MVDIDADREKHNSSVFAITFLFVLFFILCELFLSSYSSVNELLLFVVIKVNRGILSRIVFLFCRPEFNLKRAGTGPVVKAARRHSNHAISQPIRVKSLRFLRSKKNPPSSSVLPSSLRSTTHPPSSFVPSSSPASPRASQSSEAQEQHDTPRAALIK